MHALLPANYGRYDPAEGLDRIEREYLARLS
jgi:hypothetical protein